ncbi:SDR family NAD(P)-dependent oxidoreductase [Stutzerimonas stutzeri]
MMHSQRAGKPKKVVFLTSADQGGGPALAHRLAEANAVVALFGSDPIKLRTLKDELQSRRGAAAFYIVDSTDGETLFSKMERAGTALGRIDLMVINVHPEIRCLDKMSYVEEFMRSAIQDTVRCIERGVELFDRFHIPPRVMSICSRLGQTAKAPELYGMLHEVIRAITQSARAEHQKKNGQFDFHIFDNFIPPFRYL